MIKLFGLGQFNGLYFYYRWKSILIYYLLSFAKSLVLSFEFIFFPTFIFTKEFVILSTFNNLPILKMNSYQNLLFMNWNRIDKILFKTLFFLVVWKYGITLFQLFNFFRLSIKQIYHCILSKASISSFDYKMNRRKRLNFIVSHNSRILKFLSTEDQLLLKNWYFA